MAKYREPECELTLEQALQEFGEVNSGLLYEREMTDDSREFFRRHDIAHVVFGCDTTLVNEGMVKLWTAFGTTLGFWGHIAAYSRGETADIVGSLRMATVITTFFRVAALVPKVVIRCRAMTKPWPWADHQAHLGRRLVDIRREFNIKPILVS